jgi:GR25 family glycosyltransferase involved in LPS biosynthesis
MNFPIFVINLNSAKTRLEKISHRLQSYGLSFVRIPASTPACVEGNYVQYLSGTQKACTHSHIRILRDIVASNTPAALILEDDAVFHKDWIQILQEKLADLETQDPDWDCIFLNAAEGYDVNDQWHIARDQCLSGAYLIRLHAAKWMLEHHAKMFYCIDWMTQILQRRGHSYTYYPWLVIQEGADTTNTSNLDADWCKVRRLLDTSGFGLENYDFHEPTA